MKLKHYYFFFLALLMSFQIQSQTVNGIISNSPDHTILTSLLQATGLDAALEGEGPFTVFAPTDAAVLALPQEVIDAVLSDSQLATSILLYHVVGANALSTDLSDGQVIGTLLGQDITVTINSDGVFINNAQVTVADLIAENGVVHVIDAVLIPNLTESATVMDIIEGSDIHTTLAFAINAAGLDAALRSEGPFTVFAPTDDAFAALPDGVLEAVVNDTDLLTSILLYHVVGDLALSSDLTDGQVITTLNGETVTVTINADGVFINDAQVTIADITADNGVVHVINAVLLPPVVETTTVMDIIEGSDVHTTLAFAINAAGLDAALRSEGPFTVFAPTDDAFAALPDGVLEAVVNDTDLLTSILLYHVVGDLALSSDLADGQVITTLNGETVTVTINADGVFINDAQVTIADITADNGVVHVINAVLLPPVVETTTVMDIIEGSDVHTTLAFAINAAGLDAALRGEGPFTVFAPTDDAFAALPDGVLEAVVNDTDLLTSILLYHVVGDLALSSDLTDGQVITTLNGETVTVTINADGVFINDAQVTIADITADNGVVHVINAVLLPPVVETTTVMDIIEGSDVHTTLAFAINAAGLDAALRGEGPFTVFAPTDDAFAALPDGVLEAVVNDTDLLTSILLYHVVGDLALSSDLTDGQVITTLNGETVTVTINADGVFINDAQVTIADITADNGVVHVINAVLLPPPARTTVMDIIENSDVHTILTVALYETGLNTALAGEGPFTVFAPTDNAILNLPEEALQFLLNDEGLLTQLLLYHVTGGTALSTDLQDGQVITTLLGQDVTVTINNDGVFINDAQVIIADLIADNGVVHVIDAVLLPNFELTTIYDIISGSPDHTILTQALQLTSLDAIVANPSEGPFTVFAPTDAAFQALGEELLNALIANPFGELYQALRHHVVLGETLSSDLSDGQVITSAYGQDLTITINSEGVFINNAKVTIADLQAINGVVHVIDAVLIPEFGPCDVIVGGIYTDFIGIFGGAPTPNQNGECETFTLPFEAWASEGYAITGFAPGAEYTFSICEGENAGSWSADLTVYDADFNVVATAQNSCDITWLAENTTYIIVINENGACGPASQNTETDNGNPSITCRGFVPVTVMDLIERSDVHSILAFALNATGLDLALRGENQLTVFAPTDAAFEALPEGTLDALVANPELLTSILLYHVVEGAAFSGDLSNGQSIRTLNGEDVAVTINSEGIFINNAQVIVADLLADNGVLHVIDGVLLPPSNTTDLPVMPVNLYPNPASDFIWFTNKSTDNNNRYEIRDMNGKLMLNGNTAENRLNISALGQGMYFINIFNESTVLTGRFVKM